MIKRKPKYKSKMEAAMWKKWSRQVLIILLRSNHYTLRFGQIQTGVDCGPRSLSLALAEIKDAKLVTKVTMAQVPPCTLYTLTPKGEMIAVALTEFEAKIKQIDALKI